MSALPNLDRREIAKFDQLSGIWWDPRGKMRTLQAINPLRLAFIRDRAEVRDARILDVGCGGGILAEAMAAAGGRVTGIDLSQPSLAEACRHASGQGLLLEYRHASVEEIAVQQPASFDVVTCMEMLEHVPQPAAIVQACARAVRPGGQLFFSTIDRTLKAYLLAVLGGEYLLGLLPRGSHSYPNLIRPAELLGWAQASGLEFERFASLVYNPLSEKFSLAPNLADVNYLAHFRKP